ncbi:MAG: D-glucuronyl C5-epimerase family protein [Gaiellaceae bacterium]
MAAIAGSALARPPLPAQKVALDGLKRAVAKGRIDRPSAVRYRSAVNRAASLISRLPAARRIPLQNSLNQAAAMAGKLTAPRAKAVFGQLAVNDSYFATNGPPAGPEDIKDGEGVVYRYFSGRGFEFHPLANFAALNAAVAAGDTTAAGRLAEALIARGVRLHGGGIGWEYYFDYAGGRAPWLSGMAQAAAAQALAAAAGQLPDSGGTGLMNDARAAYRAIPAGLLLKLASGPWIRLYGFNRSVVLNAQLQAVISLGKYAVARGDAGATSLVAEMEQAAAASLQRFDSGYWTYYSLPRAPSPLDYQRYVVRMLKTLAPDDSRFAAAATRFASYEKQPPAFKLGVAGAGAVRFWLSKPATVSMRSTAGPPKSLSLSDGWHTLGWKLPSGAGIFSVSASARDWAGNTAAFSPLPVVRVVSPAVWTVVGSSAAQTKSVADAAESGVTAKATATQARSIGRPGFAVAAGLDAASQASTAVDQGLNALRLSVPWPAGASAPDPAIVSALRRLPGGERIIVELVASPLPADAATRATFAAYALSLAQQLPSISDLLLGPAPSVADGPDYLAALAALYDAVKPVSPALEIAGELDGSSAPKTTLHAYAEVYTNLGRSAPVMDELAFRPAPLPAPGAWTLNNYRALVAALGSSFDASGQLGSTLPILVDGVAVATKIPTAKASVYPTPPGPIPGVAESTQARAYAQALATAACLPNVSGVVFRRLVDNPAASDQSGLYYADGSAKTSATAVRTAAISAGRGVLRACPGLAVPVRASTLVFPLQLSTLSPPRVLLACTRDCLFLVTLERASDGKPVLAMRGAIEGGLMPTAVQLPQGTVLATGSSYRLRVRLVAQTNPGLISQYGSPILMAG